MIRGNGAKPQGSRILASVGVLAVATVCVVMLTTENTGDMKESNQITAEAHSSSKPELEMVQAKTPMILASDADLRHAILAKELRAAKHKEVKHKKQEEEKEEHQAARKAHQKKNLSTRGMSSSMKRMVARRNHEYNLEKRKKAMAKALMGDDSMELIQAFDFTPANSIDKAMGGLHSTHSHLFDHFGMHRSSNHHSKKNLDYGNTEVEMQIGATVDVQNFADDITKELKDFTSSSHAVASDLLYDDEENAAKAKKKVKKVINKPKKKKVKKVHKAHKKEKRDHFAEPFDRNGPMAHFVAFQSARFAMKNALGTATKEAEQSTLQDADDISFIQLPEEPELYQAEEQAEAAEQHAASSSKRHEANMQHALELIETPTANEKAAAALKKKMDAMMSHQKAAMKRQNQQAQKAMAKNAAAAKKAMKQSVKEVHQKTKKISADAKKNKRKWAKRAKKAKRKARKAAKKARRKAKKAQRAAKKMIKKAKLKAKLKEEMMLLQEDITPHERASSILAAAAKAARKRTREVELLQEELNN